MNSTIRLPADHKERTQRMLLSFDGLSIGDGFGECFFDRPDLVKRRICLRELPEAPWVVTDDSTMALSIVRMLKRGGVVNQDELARAFAEEFMAAPSRGYGPMAYRVLAAIAQGFSWKEIARRPFAGAGSCGNGGAMRSGPLGAYFAGDPERVVYEAKCSAEVTHAHPDGKTGAVAVALAAAWMCKEGQQAPERDYGLIRFVLKHLPKTETYDQLLKALDVPFDTEPRSAGKILGNGSRVIASDTAPFCLWCAARHSKNFEDALWSTVSASGDVDTTCAIVGGIVAPGLGREGLPKEWLARREPISV